MLWTRGKPTIMKKSTVKLKGEKSSYHIIQEIRKENEKKERD